MLNMLKLVKWFFIDQYVLGISSGGGASQPAATSATNTTSNISPWAQPGVSQLISSGLQNAFPNYNQATGELGPQSGYTPFNVNNAAATITDPVTGQQIANPNYDQMTATAAAAGKNSVADFTGLQNQSFNTAGNMQVPGQYGQATSLTGMAAQGNLGTIAGAGQYGQAGYNAGMGYGQNATNANAVNAYMNPYWQTALQPGLNLLNQQYGIQQNNNATQATQAGAFGGSRMGIQQGLTNQANQLAQQQMIGTGLNNAFNTAQQNMQQASTLGMQGAQQGLAGIQAQQAGYNNAANAGVNLANIGAQQLGAQQSIAGLQNAYGAQQQQQAQNVINQGAQNYSTMQAYPMQQLSQLESLYTGAPTSTTTQNFQAPPNMLSQVAGLGMAGYGLSQLGTGSTTTQPTKRTGGRIKAPDNRMKKQGAGLGDLALSKLV